MLETRLLLQRGRGAICDASPPPNTRWIWCLFAYYAYYARLTIAHARTSKAMGAGTTHSPINP